MYKFWKNHVGRNTTAHSCKIQSAMTRKKKSKVKGRCPSKVEHGIDLRMRNKLWSPQASVRKYLSQVTFNQVHQNLDIPGRLKCQESAGIVNSKHQQRIANESLGNQNFNPNFSTNFVAQGK